MSAGYAPTSSWWEVCDERKVIPWDSVGEVKISPKLPEWLHARRIGARNMSGRSHTTTIKGRTYIDW
ncbi:MAG: hypothetical protein A3H52_01290 [Candidatus Zambryskibacteria bacterium RIFCSPLOWO2_02_FULL_39_26]|nr:MAG: hypothetical protein A2W51_01680 [Candidatus Zambryskibacteria bacterium RIFCSPHIGHO2_02_39_10]OHB10124.1 MAG: hypothetical protein A3H52_01290 [Candidatus Zambryskibacteria bacterium RIFCSPLOWO2_02_FULL_39_26]